MTTSQRERAEAAFGHVQHAASEMILAAHDALEILEMAVTGAGLGGLIDRFDDVSQTVLKQVWSRARRPPTADGSTAAAEPAAAPPRPESRVERIPIR